MCFSDSRDVMCVSVIPGSVVCVSVIPGSVFQ